ncbi:MAG: spore coat associated protein CotJA [Clostridia bacterium]|nr:spore coat associated protein CotJA [Clostridia bacterium]
MPSLAMVYSPIQGWQNLLSPAEGLAEGSIFTELIKPLEVGGANCPLGGGCRK